MDHKLWQLPVVKQCMTKPVLRSSFVVAPLAALSQPERRARRWFLTLYYSICALCLTAATFLNYSLLTGYGAASRYHVLLLLGMSMISLIGITTRYEKRHHAAYQKMLRELPFRELE